MILSALFVLFCLNEHGWLMATPLYPTLETDRLVGMVNNLAAARQTSLIDAVWIEVKDGNDTARAIFANHYSAAERLAVGKILRGAQLLTIGPGEKLVLITPCALGLFGWRREQFRMDGQIGVNCCFFRNEGAGLSSDLIRAADDIAWERWPGERLYTFVDPNKTRHKRDPGRCFLRAGWRYCGWTKSGLRILECLLEVAP